MSNLKSYLAEKYMSGAKAEAILAKTGPVKKKKKRKAKVEAVDMIRDEDGGWGEVGQEKEEEEEEEGAVVANDRGFKKRRVEAANWVTIQEGLVKVEEVEEEKPQVVAAPFAGGLVNAQELKKMLPQNKVGGEEMTEEEIARAQETVYRDASGKKIDTKAARAEAARLKRLREEKEAQKMEWGKGLVQRDDTEKRKRELDKHKSTTFARYADDKDLNEELRAKEVWNDPAAAFLTKKRAKGPKMPEYTGPPPPPNRFGIRPGYRWDGVDRGNGFEKKLFETINSRKRKTAESYEWSVDDM